MFVLFVVSLHFSKQHHRPVLHVPQHPLQCGERRWVRGLRQLPQHHRLRVSVSHTSARRNCDPNPRRDELTCCVVCLLSLPPQLAIAGLAILALCNLAPFTAFGSLFETRTEVHPVLRPLLASKSMNGGVKITIEGLADDPLAQSLKAFLTSIGHNAQDNNKPAAVAALAAAQVKVAPEPEASATPPGGKDGNGEAAITIGDELSPRVGVGAAAGSGAGAASPTVAAAAAAAAAAKKNLRRKVSHLGISEAPRQKASSIERGLAAGFSTRITVYVMRTFAQRDALFGSDNFPFDPRTSLFVWSDPNGDPFTKDHIGERLMRFLVLVAAWDRKLLAENLFSAIGGQFLSQSHLKRAMIASMREELRALE